MKKQGILLAYLLLASLTISTLVFILPPVKAEPTTWPVADDTVSVFSIIQDIGDAANNGDSAPVEHQLSIAVDGQGSTSPLLVHINMRTEARLPSPLLIPRLFMAFCLNIGFLMVQR